MARNSSRRRRVNNTNANNVAHDSITFRPSTSKFLSPLASDFYDTQIGKPNLRLLEDRRFWHPLGQRRPAQSFRNVNHSLKIPSGRSTSKYPLHTVGFVNPENVAVCVRRKIRKEVLFAKRKTGKRGQKKPRFNWFSKVSCRR